MTALAKAKNVVSYGEDAAPRRIKVNLAASEAVYQGSLMGRNSAGNCAKATATPNIKIIGIASEDVTASASAGATETTVLAGTFWFVNGDTILDDDIGKVCYAYDDQTVYKSNATGTMAVAGVIVDVDSTLGVAVQVGPSVAKGVLSEFSYSLSYSQAWCYIASITAACTLSGTLPADAIVVGYDINNTDWVQGSTAIHMDLGIASDDDFYVADIGNIDATGRTSGAIMKAVGTAGALVATITTAVGTLDEMTAGSCTLKVYVQLP